MKSEVTDKIAEFVNRAEGLSKLIPGPIDPYLRKQKALWDDVEKWDRKLGPGLHVGRLVSWPQADGRSSYFVTAIKRDTCLLAHFPIGDAWHSPVVQDGKALRSAVEAAVEFKDGMRLLFGKTKGIP